MNRTAARAAASIVAVALSAVPAVAQDGRVAARSAKSVAHDVSYYASIEFSGPLQGAELSDAIGRFENRPSFGFSARLIRPPRLCAKPGSPWYERWTADTGKVVRAAFDPFPQTPEHHFFVLSFDFATLFEETPGRIFIAWYFCPRGLYYSLHTDATRSHFMLKEDGKAMLAWSTPKQR